MSICWIHSHVALEVGPQEMAQRLQDLDAERPDATALGRSERLAATAALSGTAGTEEAAGDAGGERLDAEGSVDRWSIWKISIDYWRSTPLINKPWFINPGLTLFTSICPLVNLQKTMENHHAMNG